MNRDLERKEIFEGLNYLIILEVLLSKGFERSKKQKI